MLDAPSARVVVTTARRAPRPACPRARGATGPATARRDARRTGAGAPRRRRHARRAGRSPEQPIQTAASSSIRGARLAAISAGSAPSVIATPIGGSIIPCASIRKPSKGRVMCTGTGISARSSADDIELLVAFEARGRQCCAQSAVNRTGQRIRIRYRPRAAYSSSRVSGSRRPEVERIDARRPLV